MGRPSLGLRSRHRRRFRVRRPDLSVSQESLRALRRSWLHPNGPDLSPVLHESLAGVERLPLGRPANHSTVRCARPRPPVDDASLTDFLLAGPQDRVDPYGLLATLFDWEAGDVQWLKRRDAFLDRPSRDLSAETDFDIAQVLRIHTTLELARRLGSHPQELYEQVWLALY